MLLARLIINEGILMKKAIGLVLALSLTACATCRKTDSPEVCRTKHRNHDQPRVFIAAPVADIRVATANETSPPPKLSQ